MAINLEKIDPREQFSVSEMIAIAKRVALHRWAECGVFELDDPRSIPFRYDYCGDLADLEVYLDRHLDSCNCNREAVAIKTIYKPKSLVIGYSQLFTSFVPLEKYRGQNTLWSKIITKTIFGCRQVGSEEFMEINKLYSGVAEIVRERRIIQQKELVAQRQSLMERIRKECS